MMAIVLVLGLASEVQDVSPRLLRSACLLGRRYGSGGARDFIVTLLLI
jgi:hypothetical protein